MADNRFFVLEGDNGAGKSTVIEELAKNREIITVKTPLEGYSPIRTYVHQHGSNFSMFLYYMSANFDTAEEIKKAIKKKNVICDRFVASTVLDFMIREGLSWEEIMPFYDFAKKNLPQPEITFLLECKHEERVRRVLDRGEVSAVGDNLTLDYSEKTNKLYRHLSELEGNWKIIDTTEKDIETIVREMGVIIDAL